MNILLTGARGFIGKAALLRFAEEGHALRALSRDGAQLERTRAKDTSVDWQQTPAEDDTAGWAHVLREIDVVVHLAARVHVMKDKAADPLEQFRKENTEGTERLARFAA